MTAARMPGRNSAALSSGAPAPPWTMIEGTRRPRPRGGEGVMGLTVAQVGRLAKPDGTRAAQRTDRALPPLRTARRAPRGGRGDAAPALHGGALLGPPAAGLRRSSRAAAAGRSRA